VTSATTAPGAPADLGPARAGFIAPETRWFELPEELPLELAGKLPRVRVAYRTWGALSARGDNAVVVCHALTGSADVDRWWTQMFGPGRALDPDRDFVVCSNILGSCYGTTGPTSVEPATQRPYLGSFPAFTVRDMVRVQAELARALGVRRIRMVIGGSLGGMQTLEWALMYPEMVESIVPIATPARHAAWPIGLSEAQRQAIYADPRWRGGQYEQADPPAAGLSAARMMAMCTYRTWASFEQRFGRRAQAADLFAIESYLRYQGQQLVDRFDAATYVGLTKAMDTHDVARGRGDYEEVLRGIKQPALVVSIDSDVLYPPPEQQEIARHLPHATLARLDSPHGHDAFLIDVEWLSQAVADFRGRVEGRRVAAVSGEAPRGGQAVNLFVLGKGRVGSQLLEQVRQQRRSLSSDYEVDLRVPGLADSRRALLAEEGIDLGRWRELLAAARETGPFALPGCEPLLERLAGLPAPVLVDLTASEGMEAVYEEAFRRGIHVVAANKRPLAAPWPRRERLFAARRQGRCHYHYETTVGASLPVLDTLKNLVRTGDRVRAVEGSLSGTLGFVLSETARGNPLSLAMRWAKELGYTEPDPREDLCGVDAARKAVILAREIGLRTEVSDVRLEPFLPAEVTAPGSLEALYDSLRRHDRAFADRLERARAGGGSLRYLMRLDMQDGSAAIRVGPVEAEAHHRAARLRDVEAFVAFTTDRYRSSPLLVQGAGVGGAVTAGGVLADVLRVAAALGTRASWSG
jgi:homoserine O-acetyltransferase/O-succinyltransferase